MNEFAVRKAVENITEGIYRDYPEMMDRFGELGKKKCIEDNYHHFRHLETAYSVKKAEIFTKYAVWLNHVLTSRGMKSEHLIDNFERIYQELEPIEAPEKEDYQSYLAEAIEVLKAE
ncbi:hypothetical protein LRR81_16920 [Metabacillus sp. GX 13764]|uniref:hypothetical protein n=1 Tax=Metabacillus kandeliae TaxID=2900151 RepID=UPI001E2BD215|nr:hypothetical protein [Metabacillus kandeliae]MCD7035929.1 hypothetical protein [Metabacillus kandeliae]